MKETTASKPVKCPECGKEFSKPQQLGPHRRIAHGFTVKPPAPKRKNFGAAAIDKNRGVFPCQLCDFVGKWSGGLKNHIARRHPEHAPLTKRKRVALAEEQRAKNVQAIQPVNGHAREEAQVHAGDHRIEAVAALACGRIQQLIEGLAYTHDLPPKSLSSLIIRTLGTAAQVW